MIRLAWSRLVGFICELRLESRRIEVQRALRQDGRDWRDVSWDEAGKIEYVIYGDRQAYPSGMEHSR